MKKLKIKDEKQFKGAVKIILYSIIAICVIVAFASELKTNGFESFFTIPAYKEAFAETDIGMVNVLETLAIVFTLYVTKINLQDNAEERKLEREEEELCYYLLSH